MGIRDRSSRASVRDIVASESILVACHVRGQIGSVALLAQGTNFPRPIGWTRSIMVAKRPLPDHVEGLLRE